MNNDLSSSVKCRIFFQAHFVGAHNPFMKTNGWIDVQAGGDVDAFQSLVNSMR